MPTDAALPDETPSFVPDDAFVATVRHRVRRHRRRTRQRLGAGVALVAVIAGSGLWYTNDRLSSVQRIDLGTDPTAPDPVADGTPFNLLVVGLDECETADDDMCANRLGLVPSDAPASADTTGARGTAGSPRRAGRGLSSAGSRGTAATGGTRPNGRKRP